MNAPGIVNSGLHTTCYSCLPNGSGTFSLETGWFDVLAKLKKQVFEQDVHITWERGSVYFDTVKI